MSFSRLIIPLSFAISAGPAAAGSVIHVAGIAAWTIEMEVTDYFAGVATLPGAPQIGDTASKSLVLNYTGTIDDTLTVYSYTYYDYHFSNGWNAFSNAGPFFTETTTCGFVFDYCSGPLAGYDVVEASIDISFIIVGEGGDPAKGDPVNWFFKETVILENPANSSDFHYFEASGASITGVAVPQVPLPAGGLLLLAGMGAMAATGRRRRPDRG